MKTLPLTLLLAALVVSPALGAPAADLTWDNGTANGLWDTTSANWTGSTWNNATPDSAIFGATAAGEVTLGESIAADAITVNADGYMLNTAGSNNLSASTLAGSNNLTKLGTGTFLLTGAGSYSGSLTIRDGMVELGTGASLSSGTGIVVDGGSGLVGGAGYPFKNVIRGGTLYLRSDAGPGGGDQIGSQTVTLKNGSILWFSGGGADTTTLQNVDLSSGHNAIAIAPSSNPDVMKITNLTRSDGATVEFRAAYHLMGTGEAQVRITNVNGAPIANTNGILGGWAFVAANTGGFEYGGQAKSFAAWDPTATIGAEVGSIVAATPDKANGPSGGTVNDALLSTGVATENWLANSNDNANRTITADTTINSLIEEKDVIINDGSTLTLASGGLIFRNNNFWMQTSSGAKGFLTSGTNDLYLQADGGSGDQRLRVIIKDGDAGAVTLHKSGSGVVALSEINTFTGGTIVNQGTLRLQNGGLNGTIRGDLAINDGGRVELDAGDALGYSSGATAVGAINIKGSGVLHRISGGNETLGSVAITMDGGTISSSNAGQHYDLFGGGTTVTVNNATGQAGRESVISAQIDLRQTDSLFTVNENAVLRVNLIGDDSGDTLTKEGVGTMIIDGDNSYHHATNVNAGTLVINGVHTGAGAYTIAPGATLAGSGSTDGAATIASGGSLAPGNSIGTLTFGGGLTLAGSSDFEIDAATNTADLAIVVAALVFGGDLNVTNIDGTLAGGQSFDLFDFDSGLSSGTFANVNLPALTGDLTWDQSSLYSTGAIVVVPETSAALLAALGALGLVIRRRRS